MAFQIRYGLGGGFGGTRYLEWEDSCAETKEQAEEEAYQGACEVYESYDGFYGLRDVGVIMEDEECDEDEAAEIWEEERESWLDYEVREKPEE